jgi:NADH dehydrogenase
VKVFVTGGTGFIGPKIVHALRAQDRDVRALARSPARGAQLASWGAELASGDVTDPVSVRTAMEGCSHVVHLVALLRGSAQDFHRVMTEGFRNVLAAAKEQRAERVILMSALGTNDATKDLVPYYRAKWQMEQDLEASGLDYVIVRPSFVFGPDGGALPTFVRQVKVSPVVTVIGPGLQRSQPIWVEDVAAYFARAIDNPQAANRTFEIGGPDVVTWNELYERIARVLGKRRRLVHVPFGVARTGARLTQRLPGAPLSVDQVTMLQGGDNVVSSPDAVDTFQIPLLPLDEQIRRSA